MITAALEENCLRLNPNTTLAQEPQPINAKDSLAISSYDFTLRAMDEIALPAALTTLVDISES